MVQPLASPPKMAHIQGRLRLMEGGADKTFANSGQIRKEAAAADDPWVAAILHPFHERPKNPHSGRKVQQEWRLPTPTTRF